MANPTSLSKSFQCIFCARCLLRNKISDLAVPFHRQIRGKKKSAKQTGTINVKLLTDIVGYGPQGSVIPVAPGRMRNLLYPRQKAAYVTEAQLRELKTQNIVIERDFNFGVKRAEEEQTTESSLNDEERVVDVPIRLLSPERATEILSATLPALLIFYRSPIPYKAPEAPSPDPPRRFPQQYMSTAAMDAANFAVAHEPQSIAIYGSVSTADIAESVKAQLAETEDGARVVIGADDVTIIRGKEDEDADSDRLKTLGEHQVEIQIKGGGAVMRTVSIQAEES